MDIKPVRFQSAFFADMRDVTPTPDNISFFLKTFSDRQFLPDIFQEITPEGPKNRVGLASQDNEWMIQITNDRIIVQKNLLDFNSDKFGTVEDFSKIAFDLACPILQNFSKKVHRISLISGCVTDPISDEAMQSVYLNFFRPTEFYQSNQISGWRTQLVCLKSIPINNIHHEKINAISTLTWLKDNPVLVGIMPFFDLAILHNRVLIEFDINTHQSKKEPRFTCDSIKDIYKSFVEINASLLAEWEPYLYAK
jgi:hypothetical protein